MKLYLGDCKELLKTLPDESVDLILTDPPYGISFLSGMTDNHHKLEGDDLAADEVLKPVLPEFKRVLKPKGVAVIFSGGGGKTPASALVTLEGIKHLQLVTTCVWSKGKRDGTFKGLGWHYRPTYEVAIVYAKNADDYNWYGGNTVSNVVVGKPVIPQKGEHPTPKPIWLLEHFLRLHTRPGDVVLDPFMGGGSTGVACQRLHREFIGAEIDKGYFDYAEKRINTHSGQARLDA